MRLFGERGTFDLTMSELAAEAGVARGTLYRTVDSMEQLFERVRDTLAIEVHATIARTMDAHGALDPPLRLATGLRMLVRLAHDHPPMGRFAVRFGLTEESLREMLSGPPMHDIRAGLVAGRYDLPTGSELNIAAMLMGTTVSAMWTVLEGRQTWREAGSKAAELVLRAMGVPPEEARQISVEPLPPMPRP